MEFHPSWAGPVRYSTVECMRMMICGHTFICMLLHLLIIQFDWVTSLDSDHRSG